MPPFESGPRPRLNLYAVLGGFALIAVLAQWPLLLNPGYFSHDELQWAARADLPLGSVAWLSWTDWHTFQFRPLTFNLWLLLSHALFATPRAFHAVWVVLGVGNALLLLRLMLRSAIAPPVALLFALGFVLGPYAIFTQGWVATLADLLWVGCGLLIAQLLCWADGESSRRWTACVGVFALTTLALLAKESAIVLPALIVLAWALFGRSRLLRDAVIAAALPVVAYLSLRLNVILFSPREGDVYAWSAWSVPRQWLMYQVFPLLPSVSEIRSTAAVSSRHLWYAMLFWLVLAGVTLRANRRAGCLLLVGGAIALGPVLLLEIPSDQYGYGFAAITMFALAWAWPTLGRTGKSFAVLFVLIGVWHGVNIQRELLHDGQRQARFSPALAQAIAKATLLPVRIRLPDDDAWLYQRLTHEIPGYEHVPIGDRVRLVNRGETADYAIAADGTLVPP
jgi:hypothetical protein